MTKKESFFRTEEPEEESSQRDNPKYNDDEIMDKSIKDLFPDGFDEAFDDDSSDIEMETDVPEHEISDQELALLCRERVCPKCPELKNAEDTRLRALAELDNAKKRMVREKEENTRYANEKILKDIIPALDNLNLALQHAPDKPEAKDFIMGVEMTKKQLLEALEKHGLEELGEIGQDFDPNLHEAMGVCDVPEVPDGYVCALMSKGYNLNGRLLRPAKVMVCKRSK